MRTRQRAGFNYDYEVEKLKLALALVQPMFSLMYCTSYAKFGSVIYESLGVSARVFVVFFFFCGYRVQRPAQVEEMIRIAFFHQALFAQFDSFAQRRHGCALCVVFA